MSLQVQNRPKYLIVDFPEESKNGEICMALISSTWIFEEHGILYCHWPTYLKSTLVREKVVKNHVALLTDKCIECAVTVKHSSDDYDKACLKLRKLENESEVSSATDTEERNSKKKSNKNRDVNFIYSEGSDDDSYIPVPPRFPKDKSLTELRPVVPVHDDRIRNDPMREDSISTNIDVPSTSHSQPREVVQRHENKCHCEKNSKMLERLLRDIQTIKLDMKTLLQESNNSKLTEFQQLDGKLLFKNYEELQSFNEELVEEDYFKKMQSSISLLGGRDLNDTTRKILALLVSHELAQNINWIGANNKGSFQKVTNVLKLIYGAIRRNHATANATNAEIDNSIRQWIKNAPDRAGGRAKRKNKTAEQ